MQWTASTAFGLEGITAKELRQMGMSDVTPLDTGGVRFSADPAAALEANIRVRTADRIMLTVTSGPVRSFDELFRLVNGYPWEKLLGKDSMFPIRAHCARSILMSPSDCQSIVKKAICDRLSKIYRLQWLPETGARYQVDVSIRNDIAVISLDSSGDALNKRGYRTWNGEAPIRETMAAALLEMSPWHPGIALLDPMCGTGTIPIEAAMIVTKAAPGRRRNFDIENWSMLSRGDIGRIREKIASEFDPSLLSSSPVSGSDISSETLELSKRHAAQAGFNIPFVEADARSVNPIQEKGVIVVNPPYGERLGDEKFALDAARILGNFWRANPGWTVCAISSVPGFERAFGRRCDKKRRLYNGRIECEFMTFICQNLSERKGGLRT